MTTKPPSANPQTKPAASSDSSDESSATPVGFYIIMAQQREGNALVELHTHETAEARVAHLTHGSKQHRAQLEEAGEALPEGGGAHEINRDDIIVHRLNTSEVTDF